eukprot:TRINITY_DN249_c0_g1_i19.p1 TRINITY_DN249_c0_g1~~TRINITY_DN249_c0_g1_i19.p1  ORF type:complete len:749 (+),score=214.65 TRINITY_DN249_c0_g1_i19:137-2383(+)
MATRRGLKPSMRSGSGLRQPGRGSSLLPHPHTHVASPSGVSSARVSDDVVLQSAPYQELLAKHGALEKEISSLQQQMKNDSSGVDSEVEKALLKANDFIDRLEEKVHVLEERNQFLQLELDTEREELAHTKKQSEDIGAENAELLTARQILQEELVRVKGVKEADIPKILSENAAQLEEVANAVDPDMKLLRGQLTEFQGWCAELEVKNYQISEEKEQMCERVRKLEEELERKRTSTSSNTEVKELRQELEATQATVATLQSEKQTLSDKCDDLATKVEFLEAEAQSEREMSREWEQERKLLTTKLLEHKEMTETLAEAEKMLELVVVEKEELQAWKEQAVAEKDLLIAEKEEQEGEVMRLRSELDNVHSQLQQSMGHEQALTSEINELHNQTAGVREREVALGEAQHALEGLVGVRDALLKERDELRENIEFLEIEHHAEKDSVVSLRRAVKKANQQAEEAEESVRLVREEALAYKAKLEDSQVEEQQKALLEAQAVLTQIMHEKEEIARGRDRLGEALSAELQKGKRDWQVLQDTRDAVEGLLKEKEDLILRVDYLEDAGEKMRVEAMELREEKINLEDTIRNHALMDDALLEAEKSIDQLVVERDQLVVEMSTLRTAAERVQHEAERHHTSLEAAQQEVATLKQEKKSLQRQLDLLEAERRTVVPSQPQPPRPPSGRLQALESEVSTLRNTLETLRESRGPSVTSIRSEAETLANITPLTLDGLDESGSQRDDLQRREDMLLWDT